MFWERFNMLRVLMLMYSVFWYFLIDSRKRPNSYGSALKYLTLSYESNESVLSSQLGVTLNVYDDRLT